MRAFLGLALVLAIGCGDDEEVQGMGTHDVDCSHALCDVQKLDASMDATAGDAGAGPIPSTQVSFWPAANTQLLPDAGLGLSVGFFDPTRAKQDILNELGSALQLVRWPSAERVPAHVAIADVPPYGLHLSLLPDVALAEGDYALRLQPLPARVQVWKGWPHDGLDVSRFYVGSRPAVVRIELCEKADARTKVVVTFSERVQHAKAALRVFDGDAQQTCGELTFYDSGFETLCTYRPRGEARIELDGFTLGTTSFRFTPGASASGCAAYVP